MSAYDLIVIGGGPAGTAAAITAARSGARVLLLERGRFPRHKVCGEFVSAESLELLSALLDGPNPSLLRGLRRAPRIGQGRLFVDNRVLAIPIEPPATSISRFELDAALWQTAETAGVESRQQQGVQRIVRNGNFKVSSSAEEFTAHSVINASGRWSNLKGPRRHNPAKWIGLKAHFSESAAPASVDLYFFEGGYCGVQPVRLAPDDHESRINVCAMVRADVARSLPQVLACHPALHERSAHWDRLTEPVTTSPVMFGTPRPEQDGMLMAGDAAGFVDPFIGDGISLALRSGNLAAESLRTFLQGQASLDQAIRRYREAYRRELLPVFRASSKIRALLALPKPVRWALLQLFGSAPVLTRYVVRKTRAANAPPVLPEHYRGRGRI